MGVKLDSHYVNRASVRMRVSDLNQQNLVYLFTSFLILAGFLLCTVHRSSE